MASSIAIGCGAGFSSDRLDPACALARSGRVSYLVFECVGERTLAFGHRDRMLDPKRGYNSLLEPRMRALLPLIIKSGVRIITNMGAANPEAAAEVVVRVARELQLYGLRVAYITGDDVTTQVRADWNLVETGGSVGSFGRRVVGANAYLGIEHLLPAIETGAEVIITGRFADPSLFAAPLVHHYSWGLDDWDRLAAATVMGHLLECGMQVTGGYFADPPYKLVPDLVHCAYPLAEVDPDGGFVVTKLDEGGGFVTLQTVKEQLLYEVHDPAAYLTPDVTADFSGVKLEQEGPNRIAVSGARGRTRPARLKVTVGFDGGYQGEGAISYAGPGAQDRARLARDILLERITSVHGLKGGLRIDLIGMNSLHATAVNHKADTQDVRVQTTYADDDRGAVELALWEVESLLCCGPAGGGGYRGQVTPKVITHSAFIDRAVIPVETRTLRA